MTPQQIAQNIFKSHSTGCPNLPGSENADMDCPLCALYALTCGAQQLGMHLEVFLQIINELTNRAWDVDYELISAPPPGEVH